MANFIKKLKQLLPKPIKKLLTPSYQRYRQFYSKLFPRSYKQKVEDEIKQFSLQEEVNDLPAIFHYWSNKYLSPRFQQHGFNNPNEFFLLYAIKAIKQNSKPISILSIGAGNCDTEILLAEQLIENGHTQFVIDCMDINEAMFERGQNSAREKNVAAHLNFIQADFNTWKADKKYAVIMANQCLHHVVELEHLFDQINLALTDQGLFITSDVIGRNGHQRWPEALKLLKPIWKDMPKRYKYNHSIKRLEKRYVNHDCSTEGFEGIRSQDILPLLVEKFQFELLIPFANLILVFIDRNFGPNFDVSNPEDLNFIDEIEALDQEKLKQGVIKPTQMLAVMYNKSLHLETKTDSLVTPRKHIRFPD